MWDLSRFRGNTALIEDSGKSLTYAELLKASEQLYHAIGSRCLVFSLCTNSIGSILGYTCFINQRIVPILINSHLESALRQQLLDVYQPSYLWVPKCQVEEFPQVRLVYEDYGYALLSTNYDRSFRLYDELALLLTTSGSTGSPKFVRQSYQNILSNTNSIISYLELDETERPITTLPMNYTYGLSIINTHLMVGATILVTDKGLMQKEFWNFFKQYNATSFGGVPYTYEMLDKLRFNRMDLPSLRTMTQAGGKLIPELHEKFAVYAQEKRKKFIVMYGQCEATARMGYLPADMAIKKKGSMGIAIPGGKFTLIDTEDRIITDAHMTGELVYEGKNVTLGYAECGEDLLKGDERKGILKTGDMAQFDEEGYYYIVGRKKRFLKIYGNRVNLDEIDRMIKAEFDIDCASAGADDHMCIYITKNQLLQEVKRFIVHKTGLNALAFKIIVIDEIPKNDSGKVMYSELKKYDRVEQY